MNSLAMIVIGWTSRISPSGHFVGNATGEGTGGFLLESPAMNRQRPSGVSTEREIGISLSSAITRLALRNAMDLPLPASPTSMT